jgi:hypothetical protein
MVFGLGEVEAGLCGTSFKPDGFRLNQTAIIQVEDSRPAPSPCNGGRTGWLSLEEQNLSGKFLPN